MPTKTEQADLLQVMFGRNGDSPIPVVAPATPAECFDYAIEAWRIALKYMTPVVYLSDAFLATGSEPWRIPDLADLPNIEVENRTDPTDFQPYARDPETLARPWAVPGTPGPRAPHRRPREGRHHGQRQLRPGEPPPHDSCCAPTRWPASPTTFPTSRSSARTTGDLLVLGWGSTYGAIRTAVERLQAEGSASPTPTCATSTRFPATPATCCELPKVLIPEVNLGPAAPAHPGPLPGRREGLNKVRGKPYRISEIEEAEAVLAENETDPDGSQCPDTARQRRSEVPAGGPPLSPENQQSS